MTWLAEEVLMLRDGAAPCCPECNGFDAYYTGVRSSIDFDYPLGVIHNWLYCLNCKRHTAMVRPPAVCTYGDIKRGDFVRFYNINGKDYPSVTSILSLLPEPAELTAWKERTPGHDLVTARRAATGTILHYRIGHWFHQHQGLKMPSLKVDPGANLTDRDIETIDVMWSYFLDWVMKAKPVGVEQDLTVWSETEGYAGSFDLLCKLDGVLTLVDFKTGKHVYDKYAAQLAAYDKALKESKGVAVEKHAVARFNEKGAEVKVVAPDWPMFQRALDLFRLQYAKKEKKER